ncbi:hypothetical protein HNV27_38625, partial [Myxococcus xanthus]|nr:hypothetical protein [Myxococcus xanthus]
MVQQAVAPSSRGAPPLHQAAPTIYLQRCPSDGKTMLLEMRNIRKTFPGVVALDRVNLRVQAGEIHA